jgi:predicted N-formylglutamate amidohydrolase
MARILARRLACPCHLGRWSRLLIDLNRRPGHPKLVAKRSFGIDVPGNAAVSRAERERRVRRYHTPYRDGALADVRRIIAARGTCLHLSVHSFTPVVDGEVRRADVGLLYDPSRRRERDFSSRLAPLLAAHGLCVRMNDPYRGTSDGFTTTTRHLFPASRYVALEIETNQRLLAEAAAARRMGRILADCVERVLA